MIGLEYILAVFNMRNSELASSLNINRANITMWIKTCSIPETQIDNLTSLFPFERNVFTKELTVDDEVHILERRIMQLKKLL